MSELESQFTSVLNTFWTNGIVQTALLWGLILLAILWGASAYWAFRDMEARTKNVVLPYLASGLVILATPFFFLVAILFYKIVRPPEKLGDVYERHLSEKALLGEIEKIKTCRTCERRVDLGWIICPWCRNRLNRICPNCEQIVGLDWALCAWCGRDFERPTVAPVVAAMPVVATIPATKAVPAAAAITRDWWPKGQTKPGEPATVVLTQNRPAPPVKTAAPVEVARTDTVEVPAEVITSGTIDASAEVGNIRSRKVRPNVPPAPTQ